MKFNLKVNKRGNNFSAKRKSQYITVLGTHAVLKYSRNVSAAENGREKCPLNGICTPEKNRCQNAPVFHGGSEDINDTECKMRKGQAPGFVLSNRGDLIFFKNSFNNFTSVPYSVAEQ